MDPRREALREIRDLLKSEGWGPDEPSPDLIDQAAGDDPRSERRPSVWMFVCFISLAANAALVAAFHDTRERANGVHASIALLSLSETTFTGQDRVSLTIDGMEVWRRSPGAAASFEIKQTAPVEFTSRCVVQLWRDRGDSGQEATLPGMIGQAIVTADQASEKPIGIDLGTADVSHYRLMARVTRSPLTSTH